MGEVDLIFRIAGVGILVATAHWILKSSGKEDYAFITTVGGIAVVLVWVLQEMARLFDEVKSVFSFF